MKNSIPVTQSSLPLFEDYVNEIRDIWESKWLTNMGIKHQILEKELKDYLKVEHVKLFSNGHLALEYVIKAFDLKGEVITTPFTFASTTHAIVQCGLKPVFCDINPNDFTIDASKIEALITEKTSAIIPVHVYGNICDVEKIEEIALRHNLKVIYDAAHSFGVTIDGRGIGTFGNASMFSFHATKVFNTIEGGAITLNDSTISDKLEKLKNFGISGPESVELVGGNAKMNEFQAAMGICNLRNIDREISKRREAYNRYIHNLKDLDGVILPREFNGVYSNYAYFPVIFDNFSLNRNEVFNLLRENNVFSRKYFFPLINDFDCYKDEFSSLNTPIAKSISDKVLALPLFSDITYDEIDFVCSVISKIGGKK